VTCVLHRLGCANSVYALAELKVNVAAVLTDGRTPAHLAAQV
jgi:hypothetical protein